MSKRERKAPAAKTAPPSPPVGKLSGLLGVGLDGADGHKRITTGEKFVLVGGSAETHERMTETTIKTFEELKRRSKALETIDRRELAEIIHRSTPR